MPARKLRKRKIKITESEPKFRITEPVPSTRLEMLQKALKKIPFGFTIFFTNERGKSVKFYQGAVEQESL